MKQMRILQLQLKVHQEKEENIKQLEKQLEQIFLSESIPDMIAIGEMFNCPYNTEIFPQYAEPEGGKTWQRLSEIAKKYQVYFSAGTIPEIDEEGNIYNTAYVFDPEGKQIAKHRKVHLFEINITGKQYFKESDTLSPGKSATVFDTPFGKVGLCICYDIRFPELFRIMSEQGVDIIIIPAAFNRITGPMHWELLYRARAVDYQVYLIGTSSAYDSTAAYHSYGHSIIVDPWGRTISQMDEHEGYVFQNIDIDEVSNVREQIPVLKNTLKFK